MAGATWAWCVGGRSGAARALFLAAALALVGAGAPWIGWWPVASVTRPAVAVLLVATLACLVPVPQRFRPDRVGANGTIDVESPEVDTRAGTRTGGDRRVWAHRSATLARWLVIAAAVVVVPLPWGEMILPGPVVDLAPLVSVDHEVPAGTSGHFLVTTVLDGGPSIGAALVDPFRDDIRIAWDAPPQPTGQALTRLAADLRDDFRTSVSLAAGVAVRAAGYEVETIPATVEVAAVQAGGPSDGLVRVGDKILEVDGHAVGTVADVLTRVQAVEGGDVVRLDLDRGPVRVRTGRGQVRLGLVMGVRGAGLRTPFAVRIDDPYGYGPSAGLMQALAVYDRLVADDVSGRLRVAGTGTLDADGRVGRIGGIDMKVRAARRAGAQVFLAPAEQAAEARRAAGDLRVLAVTSFDDALRQLRRLAA